MAVAGTKQAKGQLSQYEKTQLVSFLGQGRKDFRLLYSAHRDTCSPQAFHRQCDYKGPTVTVLYNKSDTIYGGYTSMSWTQAGGVYVTDPTAFLFQLKKDGVPSAKVFRCSSPDKAIYCHNGSAAIFGEGHDLHLMTGTLTLTSGVYTLNGGITFKSYDMQGVDKAGFCNDSMEVTEIEVYSLSGDTDVQTELIPFDEEDELIDDSFDFDSQDPPDFDSPKVADNTEAELTKADLLHMPWRYTVDWSHQEETSDEMRKDLEDYRPLREDLEDSSARFPCCNILLMGPVGAGKSSFLNTVTSVFRKRMFAVARSGCADKSLTTKFSRYHIKSVTAKRPLNFMLCDSRGLEADNLMTVENMRFILEGNLVNKIALEPCKTLNNDSPGFKRNPRLDEKMHVVAIFIDATSIDSMTEIMPEVTQNIKDMQIIMNSLDVPQVIILTKVDSVCEKSKEDASNVYRSQMIEQCVSKVSEMFGLPRNHIFPMKNYEKEGCLNTPVNILTMYTLKMILDQTDAYLFNHFDEIVKDYKMSGSDFKDE